MTVTAVALYEAAEVRPFFILWFLKIFILMMESVEKNQVTDGVVSEILTVPVPDLDLT